MKNGKWIKYTLDNIYKLTKSTRSTKILFLLQHGVPSVYSGDLKNDDTVLGWITKELRETGIREVDDEVLHSILERLDYVAVVYYDKQRKSDLVI